MDRGAIEESKEKSSRDGVERVGKGNGNIEQNKFWRKNFCFLRKKIFLFLT
jgi:hypothetical protein